MSQCLSTSFKICKVKVEFIRFKTQYIIPLRKGYTKYFANMRHNTANDKKKLIETCQNTGTQDCLKSVIEEQLLGNYRT